MVRRVRSGKARPRARAWSVYLVRRADGALYTGIAIDVKERLAAHRSGHGAKALRGRGPLQLVFARRVGSRGAAQRVEGLIKQLAKRDKERLVTKAAFSRRWFAAVRAAAQPRATNPQD